MIVAVNTECLGELPLPEAVERLAHLQFVALEVTLSDRNNQVSPQQVLTQFEEAYRIVRDTHRLDIVAYCVESQDEGDAFLEQFRACCQLAKATKVATLTVRSSELGTPFNEEVERLRDLVKIAAVEGVRVAIRSEIGRFSADPSTVVTLCEHVKGLGLALDPSQYIVGPDPERNYDDLLKYVYHVRLRDTSKDQLQVRVGQGIVDYNRLISLLRNVGYNRGLCVDIAPAEEIDHAGELRKLRLLLESLL